jgi:serine/threonine protein kinase
LILVRFRRIHFRDGTWIIVRWAHDQSVWFASIDKTARIVIAVVDGLAQLHELGCPHRDVAENILSAEDAYARDLGIVKWIIRRRFTTGGTITRASMQLGSWFYMAPTESSRSRSCVMRLVFMD